MREWSKVIEDNCERSEQPLPTVPDIQDVPPQGLVSWLAYVKHSSFDRRKKGVSGHPRGEDTTP